MTLLRFTRRTLIGALAASPFIVRASGAIAEAATLTLKTPQGRHISIWSCKGRGHHAGTIVFSHGAASSPWKYSLIIDKWVAAGFDVLAPLHVDSVDHPHRAEYKGFTGWRARIEDMRAISAHIGKPNYIAAGHSYGALTALVMGGAAAMIPEGVTGPLRDPSVSHVVAFSPPGPLPPLIDAGGYAETAVPALIQTGTRDLSPLYTTPESWHNHLSAFDTAEPGNHRYALVLDDVDHYFGGAICDYSKPGPPQLQALNVATDISLLFLQSFVGRQPDFKGIDARLSKAGPIWLRRK